MRIIVLAALFLVVSCSKKPQTEIEQWEAQAENITIIRDDFGVPHIYGKTDADEKDIFRALYLYGIACFLIIIILVLIFVITQFS